MKKSLRNLIVGAVMAATVITASATAFAGQYVQTDMNFRSGASKTCASIGSVPAGAEVEVLGSTNGWDLVKYNGKTGYIHGGNLGSSYTVKPQQIQPQQQNSYSSTQNYFDNNWTNTAANMNANASVNTWKTVSVVNTQLPVPFLPYHIHEIMSPLSMSACATCPTCATHTTQGGYLYEYRSEDPTS